MRVVHESDAREYVSDARDYMSGAQEYVRGARGLCTRVHEWCMSTECCTRWVHEMGARVVHERYTKLRSGAQVQVVHEWCMRAVHEWCTSTGGERE